MAPVSRIGEVKIAVEGAWDIADLLALAESLSKSYGLFLSACCRERRNQETVLHDQLRKMFWSGDTYQFKAHWPGII